MSMVLRRGAAADAARVGEICYRAFASLADLHNFPRDFPNAGIAAQMLSQRIAHPGCFDLVAEIDGRIVGSTVLDERNPICGVGPITVDPEVQNDGIGRALMEAMLIRSRERQFPGIRLVQAGYHCRSLALYLKLGFEAREQLACLQGSPIGKAVPGCTLRTATQDDLAVCNQLCFQVHGHDRGGELADMIDARVARVVERAGRITGYTTAIAFDGHAIGESNDDLQALIAGAASFEGPGFLVPTRNGALLRWCLQQNLRITQTMTLMSIGLYNTPDGAWLPSVTY
jgi:predicted N-acetyltransferase YhbS